MFTFLLFPMDLLAFLGAVLDLLARATKKVLLQVHDVGALIVAAPWQENSTHVDVASQLFRQIPHLA